MDDKFDPTLFWTIVCEMSTLRAEEHGIDPDGHRGLVWTLVILAHYKMPAQASAGLKQQKESRKKLEALMLEAHERNLVSDDLVLKACEWDPFEIPSHCFWLAQQVIAKIVKKV